MKSLDSGRPASHNDPPNHLEQSYQLHPYYRRCDENSLSEALACIVLVFVVAALLVVVQLFLGGVAAWVRR